MVLKFYYDIISPPARAVLSVLKRLNVQSEFINVRMFQGEHKTSEFLKINPQGRIPVIDDDGFILTDSAINIYLVSKYADNDKLYPSDIVKRAAVHEKLFFCNGELFVPIRMLTKSIAANRITRVDDYYTAKFESGYDGLENFLRKSQFIAGDDLTIADFFTIACAVSMEMFVPLKKDKFPLLDAYLKRAATWPHHAEIHEAGVSKVRKFFENKKFTPHL